MVKVACLASESEDIVTTADPEDASPEDVVDRIMADPAMNPRVVALFNAAQEAFKAGHVQDCSCVGCTRIRLGLYNIFQESGISDALWNRLGGGCD